MLSRRTRLLAVLPLTALTAAFVLTGCGDSKDGTSADPLATVTVSGGSDQEAPQVTVKPTPLSVSDTRTRVITGGTGDALAADSIVQVRFVMLNGTDGKQVSSTFGQQDFGFALDSENVIPGLSKGLQKQKVGSRLLLAVPPADAFGTQGQADLGIGADDSVVFLVDVLREVEDLAEATGKAVAPKAGLPTVKVTAGAAASFTIPKTKAPTKTVAQPLVIGTGAKVTKGQTIRIAYTGALYKDGSVFDSSANTEKKYFDSPIGVGSLIKGWDNTLVGQTVGSRVLLVIPPADGYGSAGSPPKISGTDTLVFVVDILAAF